MQSDLTNSGKHYNLSIPSNQDNTVCLYEDTQEFKNPFLQEDNSGNDLGFSAYGFNQNLWINWEQSNPFDWNFVWDNTFQTARIDKFKVLPDSGSVLHHTDVYNNMKNMKEEYYDEHKPENCNVHNSKDDVLVYSRKSLIDQACSPYSWQTKDTLQTTIQSPFLLKSANGVVKYGSKIQAQGFEQNIPSTN